MFAWLEFHAYMMWVQMFPVNLWVFCKSERKGYTHPQHVKVIWYIHSWVTSIYMCIATCQDRWSIWLSDPVAAIFMWCPFGQSLLVYSPNDAPSDCCALWWNGWRPLSTCTPQYYNIGNSLLLYRARKVYEEEIKNLQEFPINCSMWRECNSIPLDCHSQDTSLL